MTDLSDVHSKSNIHMALVITQNVKNNMSDAASIESDGTIEYQMLDLEDDAMMEPEEVVSTEVMAGVKEEVDPRTSIDQSTQVNTTNVDKATNTDHPISKMVWGLSVQAGISVFNLIVLFLITVQHSQRYTAILEGELQQLKASHDELKREQARLVADYALVKKEKDDLQATVEPINKGSTRHHTESTGQKNPFEEHMQSLFLDEAYANMADVLFEVSSDDESKVECWVHSLILEAGAPALAQLYQEVDGPVVINIEPQVFLQLLAFVHGFDIEPDTIDDSKLLINAADRYDMGALKNKAEEYYVAHVRFTSDNVIGEYMYADENNCQLLKDSAKDFIVKNARKVVETDSFDSVLFATSMLKEIILALAMVQGDDVCTSEKCEQA